MRPDGCTWWAGRLQCGAEVVPVASNGNGRLCVHHLARLGRIDMVYLARRDHDGQIKIGHSVDVVNRVRGFNRLVGGVIVIAAEPGGRARERELHRVFRHLRQAGEWFLPGPELLAYVEALNTSTIGWMSLSLAQRN